MKFYKLKDFFNIYRPNTTSREFFDLNKGIPCIHYGDIYKYYDEKILYSSKIINKYVNHIKPEKLIHNDAILIPDVTETVNDYGHLTYIKYQNPFLNGTHTFAILNIGDANLKYLFYYLQSEGTKKRLQSLLMGSTVFQLSYKDIENFDLINYHSIEIQQHIVDTIHSVLIFQ